MSREHGPERGQQRTVAELLAQYGDGSGDRAPRRRRRRADDANDTAPQAIIDRVVSESGQMRAIRDEPEVDDRPSAHVPPPPPQAPPPPPPVPQRDRPPAGGRSGYRSQPGSRPSMPSMPPVPPPGEQTFGGRPGGPPSGWTGEHRRPAGPPPADPPSRRAMPAQNGHGPHGQGGPGPSQNGRGTSRGLPAQSAVSSRLDGGQGTPPPAPPRDASTEQMPRVPDASEQTEIGPPPEPFPDEPQGVPGGADSGPHRRPEMPRRGGPGFRGGPPSQPGRVLPPPPGAPMGGPGQSQPLPVPPRGDGGTSGRMPPAYPPPGQDLFQYGGPDPTMSRDLDERDDFGRGPFEPAGEEFDGEYDDYDDLGPDGEPIDRLDDLDDLDEPAGERSPAREWALMGGQLVLGVLGGAAVWLAFNWLWGVLPAAALVVAIVVTVGLVLIVRKIRRAEDLQTTVLAVLVGLIVTVSPAALLLLKR